MNKREFLELLDYYDDEESIADILQDIEEHRRDLIEELEERQHQNGFYAFQDMMDLRRYER